jgi:hypothetical protein
MKSVMMATTWVVMGALKDVSKLKFLTHALLLVHAVSIVEMESSMAMILRLE